MNVIDSSIAKSMLSRRRLIAGGAALAVPVPRACLGSELKLNDDGLYTKPWFLESLLDLPTT